MKKLIIILSFLALILSFNSTYANPCLGIAKACMKAGYYKGGNAKGKGLVVNCMLPITAKKMELPNTSFSDESLYACHTMLVEKMEEQMSH